jgi:ubiquinone/menaquinone biosynthesis C-methylase UbiE
MPVDAVGGTTACRICAAPTVQAGHKRSSYSGRTYAIRHCPSCRFSFVADPWTTFEQIYNADYYAGRGADPLVDYIFELEHSDQTIRHYEWSGVLRIIRSLIALAPDTEWLDYGAGNGGLVRFVREHNGCRIVGFDEGAIRIEASTKGIPYLDKPELDASSARFDVVTAIEVLEHVIDPVAVLKEIRRLLKPGGVVFLTTGNARPYRGRLLSWPYVLPDIHVSFFEPATLERALTIAGFRPETPGFVAGFADVIRFKVLKNLGVRRRSTFEKLVPWPLLARMIDLRVGVTAHPVGRVPAARADDEAHS